MYKRLSLSLSIGSSSRSAAAPRAAGSTPRPGSVPTGPSASADEQVSDDRRNCLKAVWDVWTDIFEDNRSAADMFQHLRQQRRVLRNPSSNPADIAKGADGHFIIGTRSFSDSFRLKNFIQSLLCGRARRRIDMEVLRVEAPRVRNRQNGRQAPPPPARQVPPQPTHGTAQRASSQPAQTMNRPPSSYQGGGPDWASRNAHGPSQRTETTQTANQRNNAGLSIDNPIRQDRSNRPPVTGQSSAPLNSNARASSLGNRRTASPGPAVPLRPSGSSNGTGPSSQRTSSPGPTGSTALRSPAGPATIGTKGKESTGENPDRDDSPSPGVPQRRASTTPTRSPNPGVLGYNCAAAPARPAERMTTRLRSARHELSASH